MNVGSFAKLSGFVLVLYLGSVGFAHWLGQVEHTVQTSYQAHAAQLNKY
jgi:hypothetical protein